MLVLLEGNIAAGKTTLGQELAGHPAYRFIPEPLAQWQTGFAENLLARFYQDTPRWAFTMQIGAFVTRARTYDALTDEPDALQVFERSIYCDRHVFAPSLHQSGLMDETEWALYQHFWEYMAHNLPAPDAFIYLRTPAEECYHRLRERARSEEATISLDYLRQLEVHHDAWLLDHDQAEAPVVVLDGTQTWTADDLRQQLSAVASLKTR